MKSPPAPDYTVTDRGLYDLAYALLTDRGNNPDWGVAIELTRTADDGSIVRTIICIPEAAAND